MIKQLWATPFLQDKVDDEIRDGMIQYIIENEDLTKPPSDFGTANILKSDDDRVRKFVEQSVVPAIDSYLKETVGKSLHEWAGYRLHGWLAGAHRDYSISYHNHRGAQLSCVFYLLAEEVDKGGQIVFTDPRLNANRGFDASFEKMFEHLVITPKSGDFVIFPSFLYHFVSTYQSTMRIALPIDVFLYAD